MRKTVWMKQISTIVSWVSLVAVGVLFVLHFSHSESVKKQISVKNDRKDTSNFRIAYFDIDSLQEHFNEFQDAQNRIKAKESASKNQLNDMNVRYQKRLVELQEKARAQSMTQAEGEAAQRELARMENEFRQKEMELDQELKKMQMELMNTLNKHVEDYLKVYNQNRGYAYVFSYQPGMLMYYKDSLYDITQDMINGLNAQYNKEKK